MANPAELHAEEGEAADAAKSTYSTFLRIGLRWSSSRSRALASASGARSSSVVAAPAISSATSASSTEGRRRLGRASGIKDAKLRELLEFDGCEALLRGCRLRKAIGCGARIFGDSKGDASTYAMSEQTVRLKAFVSHNWVVSRWKKYACLAFHFNYWFGAAAVVMVMGASPLIHYFGLLPTYFFNGAERGFAARLASVPAALFAMFLGRDVFPLATGPLVFLDKVCIHQEDKALQKKAIEKLGAYLKASDNMLICYTDVYLTKLWTVYEVASYLSLFGTERMQFTHCSVSVGITVAITVWWFIDVVTMFLQAFVTSFAWAEFIVLPGAFVGFALALRAMVRGKASMYSHMVNFSVHQCTCFCEDDRAVVYRNIVALMQAVYDQEELPPEAALQRFDRLVREELPSAMNGVFGRFGAPLNMLLIIPTIILLPRAVDLLPMLWHGGSLRSWFVYVLFYIGICSIITPIIIMVISSITRLRLRAGSTTGAVVVLAAASAGLGVPVAGRLVILAVEARALASDAWLAGYSAGVALLSVLVPYFYAYGLGSCGARRSPALEPVRASPRPELEPHEPHDAHEAHEPHEAHEAHEAPTAELEAPAVEAVGRTSSISRSASTSSSVGTLRDI